MRIDNHPFDGLADLVETGLAGGGELILQYSEAAAYDENLLSELDRLCAIHDGRLQIRFYGHYRSPFDMRTVLSIPNVKTLLVDCLMAAAGNIEVLAHLQNLQSLNLDIFELDKPNILASPNLASLRALTLGPTRKNNIDLAPIGAMADLRNLSIFGQARNIAAVGRLRSVEHLSLNAAKTVGLGFINTMAGLRDLKLILGGRDNIDEVDGQGIESLEIVRVRGFDRFDHLPRWHTLKHLVIEDQIRLPALTLSAGLNDLETLRISNCKTLSALDNLSALSRLRSLDIFETALDFEALCARGLPPSLQIFGFSTGRAKADEAIQLRIEEMGFK